MVQQKNTSKIEYVHNWCPKEYRQSDEWKKKDLSEKLAMALKRSTIDDFIERLIENT